LCQVFFLRQKNIDENLAARFLLEGLELHWAGRPSESLAWVENGLKLYPQNIHLLNLYGVLLIELTEYEKAREGFSKLLERADNPPMMQALFQNNLAYLNALIGRADLLAEADELSQKTLATIGWHPSIKGTRGTVLLALGKPDEAIPLLLAAMQEQVEITNKAQNACWISMAEARRGNLTESKKFLDEAGKLLPSCFLLERALNELHIATLKQTALKTD
ncbi:MAG TPA: hypothetical protein VGO57_16590, partial [Verrucomicrobiae bacterium]